MALQHHLADPVIPANPRDLFCLQRSQQMRITRPKSTHHVDEIRIKERGRGHQVTNDTSRTRIELKKPQPSVQDVMLASVPSMRAFAISLCGNADRADDLVQGTLVRAIASIDSFTPGTNMPAWLFTILRNVFRDEFRKRRYEVEDADGSYVASLTSAAEQHIRLEFKEFAAALATLPVTNREALLLVGAAGFSYDDAAAICDTPIGTVKSRVYRARKMLAELVS